MPEQSPHQQAALLITRNLPPLRGGMERLIHHVVLAIADSYDLTVIGPEGCEVFLPEQTCTHAVPSRPLPRFLWSCLVTAFKSTRKQHFKLVIAGSGLTAPLAWWAARRSGARSVVYLHGLDIIAPSRVYRLFWLPFIRRMDLVLVNSRNSRQLAIDNGVPEGAIEILHPGTDLPGPDADDRRAFRADHSLGNEPLLLSIGRFTPRKGLAEFITHALPDIIAERPDAILVVIGADASDAVRPAERSERARILDSARKAGLVSSVRMLPPCSDAMLSQAYRAADVYVFPVLDLPGDVEGFGMVAIEAAAHGLPTVGFRVGGVPDAIIDGQSGTLVEAGEYAVFAKDVLGWLKRNDKYHVQSECSAAAEAFGWQRFAEKLNALLVGKSREMV